MGVGYTLVNIDKKQTIDFYKIKTGTKLRELSGTVIASTIVTYYLLTNTGDRIAFIDDTYSQFNLFGRNYQSDFFDDFIDMTDKIVDELIEQEIIQDNGVIWIDKEDNLFFRDLINVWEQD